VKFWYPMNVLLVTVDSLRADRVGANGYDRNTTPFLDSLAREYTFFPEAYSTSNHTREAVPSILTGFYPENSVTRMYRIKRPTLAETLSEKGYDTGAFVSSPFFTSLSNYDDGFDVFESKYSMNAVANFAGYVRDILANSQFRDGFEVNESVVEFVENSDEPFLAWGHYMDVHAPYNRFEKTFFGKRIDRRKLQLVFRKANYVPSALTDGERRMLEDFYDNSVRHFDRVMRDLFERLSDAGVLRDTVVFVVSDHGESLGEDGRYEHHDGLDSVMLQVPLWIHGCDVVAEGPVSTVDIAPTVVERVGAEKPDDGFDGVPLESTTGEERPIRASCLSYFRRQEKMITEVGVEGD